MRLARMSSVALIILLLLVLFFISRRTTQVIDNESFNRNSTQLHYTQHARCRMDCRQITESEIEDIFRNGTINSRKSDPLDKPCPTFALEGYTKQDGQHVRIVFAQCEAETRVVTVIDLDKEFTCNCK